MKAFRYLIFSVLGILGLMGGHLVYLYNHREFSPPDFRHPNILKSEDQAPDSATKQKISILEQKFTYLGSGTQMTAYESADHQYVIKFFNPRNTIKKSWFHHYSRLREMSSLKWTLKTYFEKEERLQKLFKCFCPFVLQKRVDIAMEHLKEQLAKGAIEEAKKRVRQIYHLFLTRAQKGYTDHRQSLFKNYGFAYGSAVQLDVGRIKLDERVKKMPLKDLERIVVNLSKQLPPQLIPVLKECLVPP